MLMTTTANPATMSPEHLAIINDYKKICEERFLKAILNAQGQLIVWYKTQGGYFVTRRFFDPQNPAHYESLYFRSWNDHLQRPEDFILSRINNPF